MKDYNDKKNYLNNESYKNLLIKHGLLKNKKMVDKIWSLIDLVKPSKSLQSQFINKKNINGKYVYKAYLSLDSFINFEIELNKHIENNFIDLND